MLEVGSVVITDKILHYISYTAVGKSAGGNLQYGPRKRLVRGIYK